MVVHNICLTVASVHKSASPKLHDCLYHYFYREPEGHVNLTRTNFI